ncbi:MAG: alpha/beta hydrolase [Arthrobacter sp.]|uniref:alpha/beta hydrolase n=1 Tax=unclassified Arthrobacter TaxID=235627 RepID=UPI0026549A34|nr:alpha/beta hydrolase [Micrococcaceae bacterium]MDN5813272.1 alpha/beta hydrolase [Micrococcaceae bacterium]MDN5825106.1 alpha/beta hydrolase [Micrococcaceae bacterium]MDN5880149.1 alpha/beta hydrolase [Micrococcaceae bacterium]MDN5886657.1 alpha/beta hydrolase [Micrococcaceae bacterium]
MRIYVPGANRTGRAAWPKSTDDEGLYVSFAPDSPVEQRATLLGQLRTTEPGTVIAHSLGAAPTLLAIAAGTLRPARLVLVEPALFDLIRGTASVEEHIAVMTRARKKAAEGDLFGYWALVKPRLFGGPALAADWPQDEPHARRFSTLPPPWGHDISPDLIEALPTLVLSGGWNEHYEAVAEVLARQGAGHRILPGSGHRAQDDPGFEALIASFEQLTAG